MKEVFKHFLKHKLLMACCILTSCMAINRAQAQTCEGRISLKDGSKQLYVGEDRIEMPRKMRDVETYRDFFSHNCQRGKVSVNSIDSITVWNTDAPANTRILVPVADLGWCWQYINHPRIQVYVYSSLGYSVNALGGMKAYQDNTVAAMFLIPGKTACDFYVFRHGERPVCLGDVYKKCDKSFIRKLCHSAGIDADTEQTLLKSKEVDRSSMIQRIVEILDEY